jgi:hypothetical protein
MYTGARAFEGVPRALLGHQITREHKRPRFPEDTPWAYRDLAERCWQPNWEERCGAALLVVLCWALFTCSV